MENMQKGMVVLGVAVDDEGDLMIIWEYDFKEGKAYKTILEREWMVHSELGRMMYIDKTQVIDWEDDVENVREMIRGYKEGGWKVYMIA
jgi:hypothetical protein